VARRGHATWERAELGGALGGWAWQDSARYGTISVCDLEPDASSATDWHPLTPTSASLSHTCPGETASLVRARAQARACSPQNKALHPMLGRGWICVRYSCMHHRLSIESGLLRTVRTDCIPRSMPAVLPPSKDHGEARDSNNPIPRETRPLRVVPRNISQTRSKVMHALVIEAQPGRNKKQGIKNLSLVACR
jgi:hypothetical protein